ncbi:MAG: DUF6549 family protein [Bacteroidota bacterium]|nr:DUF6549 family protein [Bacteroidota bacterium]
MTKERITLAIITVVLLISSISQCHRANQETKRADQYELNYYLAEEEATKWKESDSTWRAEIRVLETTNEALENSNQLIIEHYEDKIKDIKRASNIEGITITSTFTQGGFKVPVQPTLNIECNHKFKIYYEDEWSKFDGLYETGIFELTYSVRDSINYVSYWKRPGFLKRKQLFTQGISHNPNTQITGLKDIRIKAPKPVIQVSAGLSGAYYQGDFILLPTIQLGTTIFTVYWR